MKRIKFLIIVCVPLFYFSTCEKEKEEPCNLRIVNNSDQRIFHVTNYDSSYIYRKGRCYSKEALVDKLHPYPEGIAPNDTGCSNAVNDPSSENLQRYIFIYIYDEIKDMSCEEFKQKDPIKKIYAINRHIADSLNWTIVYDGQ